MVSQKYGLGLEGCTSQTRRGEGAGRAEFLVSRAAFASAGAQLGQRMSEIPILRDHGDVLSGIARGIKSSECVWLYTKCISYTVPLPSSVEISVVFQNTWGGGTVRNFVETPGSTFFSYAVF